MRKFFYAAAVVGVMVLGTATPARAAFEIALQEAGVNGGASTVVVSGTNFSNLNWDGTYGDFTVEVLGGSAHNAASLSDLLSSTTRVTNNSSATQTLKIIVSQTDYTLPSGSTLSVESGLGGSVSTGTLTMTNIFQAYADAGNTLRGTTDFTTGPQTASPNGSTFDTGSARGTFLRTGSYSLTTITTFTLSGGGVANFSAHENVTAPGVVPNQPLPAPAGLVLALTGIPVLGLGAWVRRRAAGE